MFDQAIRIHVVVDESDRGLHTADLGIALAARMRASATFHIAIAMESLDHASPAAMIRDPDVFAERCRTSTAIRFDHIRLKAQAAGIDSENLLTVDETPCATILKAASDRSAALIVVGTRGRSNLVQAFAGSLAAELIRLASQPVVVCRADTALPD